MVENVRQHLWFISALVLGTVIVLLPNIGKENLPDFFPGKPIKLGLDLRGGAYLVMRVVTEDAVKSQLSSMATSVRAEFKNEGIPILKAKQIGENALEVSLLNDRQIEAAREIMRRDYNELREVSNSKDGGRVVLRYEMIEKKADEVKHEAVLQAIEVIRNRVDSFGVAEPVIQRVGEELIMVQLPDYENVEEVKRTIGKVAKLEFRLVAKKEGAEAPTGEVRTFKVKKGGTIQLEDTVLMTGDAIKTARVDFSPKSVESSVAFELNSLGSKTFSQITSENVGRQLAIILDGVVQSSPNINSPITGGHGEITGSFTEQEAHQLAVVLRSGALPAEIKVDTESTVGASLGADAIRKGFIALASGFLAVVTFIIFYYKRSGVLALIGLVINFLVLLSLLSMLGATLTLPGMAGLILTVAMALDANVIIFERIKEELKNGASPTAAIQAGFVHAHWTVMDSNITTFMTGLFLFMFGTGPIKGFAVTLCLGILSSLFAALYVARVLFRVMPVRKSSGELSI